MRSSSMTIVGLGSQLSHTSGPVYSDRLLQRRVSSRHSICGGILSSRRMVLQQLLPVHTLMTLAVMSSLSLSRPRVRFWMGAPPLSVSITA